ncbi:mitochondrial transcription termination factor 5 [Dermatophagoides pteronyssinus]|uniref:mitochondrial transcription termination factor 5 n=1 Tax=Dermatophagoides pteronyssinus TaxID=6956 RepID=UPI003F67F7E6
MNSIRLMTGIFNRNFGTKRSLIQSRTNANSSTSLKFQHSNDDHPLNSTTFDNEKIDENFFEQYVSHEFQMSRMETKKIYFLYDDLIRKNYPTNESIVHLCKFLKLFFTAKEIQYNPKPFLLPFQQLYNRTLLLKEIGFRSIQIPMIGLINEILKLNLLQLRQHFDYPIEQNCFDKMCKHLEIYGDTKTGLSLQIENFYEKSIDQIPLNELRIQLTACYLSNCLKISNNRSLHLCRKNSRLLMEINLMTIKMNITFLQNNFNYSANKIINNGLFLMINPENLSLITTKLRSIVGDHLYEHLIIMPEILRLNFNQIIQNFELIKQKCDGQFYIRSIDLISMDPERLISIFNSIDSNEDFKQLNLQIFGPDFLALNYQKILNRIEKLKQEEIPFNRLPLTFFTVNDLEFKHMLNDLINDPELRIRFFLEIRFGIHDYNRIKNQLYHISNVNTEKYSRLNANRVIEFLISMNFDKELIIEFVYLIFFDYKLVKGAYFYLCNRMDRSSTTSTTNKLFLKNLVQHLQTTRPATKILQNISYQNLMS